MGVEEIGYDDLKIVANNQALGAGASIQDAQDMQNFAFVGVSLFSTQAGTIKVEYRMAEGQWRDINGSPFVTAANAAFDRVWRKQREEYRFTYTDTSLVASNVDLEVLRSNVN